MSKDVKIDVEEMKAEIKTALKAKKKVYIAYGSNMDICRMDKRCPDFEFYGIGYIYNYRLTFQRSISGFYANMVSSKSKKDFEYVPVVLYLISEEDEELLDMFEGYPQAYKKSELEVELEDGSRVKGLVYLLPSNKSYGIPSIQYYRLIENAYKIFGFDLKVLKNALVWSYKKAKTSLNLKKNSQVNRILPKKAELTILQKKFIEEFNSKNKSDWEMRELEGKIVLHKKDSVKSFEVTINKNRTISLKDVKSNSVTTVENLDSLVRCCSTVKE